MEAVFRTGCLKIFSATSGQLQVLSCRKRVEITGDIRSGIQISCSTDVRCFPAGSSTFRTSFQPVPVKSAHFRKPESSTWAGLPARQFHDGWRPVPMQPVKLLSITEFDYSSTLHETSSFPNRKIG